MSTPVSGSPGGIQARGIVKRYGGVPVLRGVSIDIRPGEVVGLVGHNGAGKSTLLRVISGATRPDAGTLHVNGVPQALGSPADGLEAGVATVYQELSLLSNLTVAQNAFLGDERVRGGLLLRDTMRREARDLVERFGLDVDVDRKVGEFPVATRQLLEIAIAAHRKAGYLLLDEPTTSLEGRQIDTLLDAVRSLAHAQGLGILLVNHKLDELYAVATRVVALVEGQVTIDGGVAEVSRAQVIQAIAGEEGLAIESRRATPSPTGGATAGVASGPSETGLSVRSLRTPRLHDISLDAVKGRVLGVYGLVGSGRTELLRTLVGLDTIESGSLALHGKPYEPKNPGQAQAAGVVYVTEERKTDGIVPGMDSAMNVVLPVLSRFRRFGFLDHRAMRREAGALMDVLRVRGNRTGPVVSLSGGNQQKVLLARALAQRPGVLLLDEPTKGVDLGVKAEIHRIVRDLAHGKGLTVIVVSSEEEEICEVADDIVVIVHGRSTGRPLAALATTPRQLREAAWAAA